MMSMDNSLDSALYTSQSMVMCKRAATLLTVVFTTCSMCLLESMSSVSWW